MSDRFWSFRSFCDRFRTGVPLRRSLVRYLKRRHHIQIHSFQKAKTQKELVGVVYLIKE